MAEIQSVNYWIDIVIQASQEGENVQQVLKKVPEHLIPQVIAGARDHFKSLEDEKFQDEEIKEKYSEDLEYGIDEVKDRALADKDGIEPIKIVSSQVEPFIRGKSIDEHHELYGNLSADELSDLNNFKRDTGSANQTDILPHLFKKQNFYEHVKDDLDKTIAVSKEGFRQYYFLTRAKKRVSGSVFREMAELDNTEEELLPRDLTRQGVIERRVDNFNPFQGNFVFRSTYGAPPTASLSSSIATASAVIDLGVKDFGSEYLIYNTTTGSLSSGSHLDPSRNFKFDGQLYLVGASIPTTASIFTIQVKSDPTIFKYVAKWEQNITSRSIADISIPVSFIQKRYKPSVTNGNLNQLFPTKKTVLKNGNIFIT